MAIATVGDFNAILNDLKRTVSWYDATKTISPMNGVETVTYASAVSKEVVFFRNDNKYIFDKEGIVEVGDAYIMAPTTMNFAREDKVTIDGETYIIQKIIRRHMADVQLFDYCILYLLE